MFATYAHCKPDGTIFYIGKGSIKRAYSASCRNVIWQRIVKKHGGFEVKILAKWKTEEDAFDHEKLLIDCFRSMNIFLANISDGGLGSTGFRHTEEFKKQVAYRAKTNNPMNDLEVRKRQKENLIKAMNRPEIKEKQRKARLGMKFSESHIEALRNCHPVKPCVVNGVTYKSLMEASRILKIRHGTIHRWITCPEIKRGKKYAYITECRWA
jgi:hypothetical protein